MHPEPDTTGWDAPFPEDEELAAWHRDHLAQVESGLRAFRYTGARVVVDIDLVDAARRRIDELLEAEGLGHDWQDDRPHAWRVVARLHDSGHRELALDETGIRTLMDADDWESYEAFRRDTAPDTTWPGSGAPVWVRLNHITASNDRVDPSELLKRIEQVDQQLGTGSGRDGRVEELRARVLRELGRPEEAVQELRGAVEFERGHVAPPIWTRALLIRWLIQDLRLPEAAAEVDAALDDIATITSCPRSDDAYHLMNDEGLSIPRDFVQSQLGDLIECVHELAGAGCDTVAVQLRILELRRSMAA